MYNQDVKKNDLTHRNSYNMRKNFIAIFAFITIGFLLLLEKPDIYTDDFFLFSLSYKDIGFAPKIFFGSVLSLFIDFVSIKFLHTLYIISAVIFAILLSLALSKTIEKSTDKEEKFIITSIVIVFLTGSVSVMFGITSLFTDLQLTLYFLLCLLVMNRKYLKFLIPVFLFCAIATHHAFSFAYMPAVAILLLFNISINHNKKSNIILFIISLFVMAAASSYFYLFNQFFSDLMKIQSLEGFASIIGSRTDAEYEDIVIQGYFLLKPKAVLDHLAKESSFKEIFRILPKVFPFLLAFRVFWIKIFRKTNENLLKIVYLCASILPIAYVPLFIVSADHLTTFSAVIISDFALLIYMFNKERGLRNYLNELFNKIKKIKWLQFILISFAIFWSAFLLYYDGIEIIIFR